MIHSLSLEVALPFAPSSALCLFDNPFPCESSAFTGVLPLALRAHSQTKTNKKTCVSLTSISCIAWLQRRANAAVIEAAKKADRVAKLKPPPGFVDVGKDPVGYVVPNPQFRGTAVAHRSNASSHCYSSRISFEKKDIFCNFVFGVFLFFFALRSGGACRPACTFEW
jgi:hypothetical protein